MSYVDSYQVSTAPAAAEASVSERVAFIKRTYFHLAGAIFAFVFFEYVLIQTSFAIRFVEFAFATNINWLIILVLFMVTGAVADRWARSDRGPQLQYLGLALYTAAEAVLFLPLLVLTTVYSSPSLIPTAGMLTLFIFGGLSALVFLTGKDFSYLRMGLYAGGLMAMGVIAAALLLEFNLGVLFSFAMVGLASGYVIYDTSNMLHHYRTDQHVAAALALFASIGLMFWYIVRLLLAFSWDD